MIYRDSDEILHRITICKNKHARQVLRHL